MMRRLWQKPPATAFTPGVQSTPGITIFRHRRSAIERGGFTLIEVLIALGLSVVLLTAVYASIQMLWRFQQTGRTDIRINQIQRSLIRMLTEDLGSVMLQLPETTSSAQAGQVADSIELDDGAGSSASSSAPITLNSSPMTLSGIDEAGVPLLFGLVGNAESFHLTISRPARDLAYDSLYGSESTSGRLSDLQLVSWGQAPLPPNYYEPAADVRIAERPQWGLGRRALDLFGTMDVDAMLTEVDLLAPEVTEIQFEYFDGALWVQEWDSQAYAALPRAVRVTFGYWSQPLRPPGHVGVFVAQPVITFHSHVVPVPMSEPYVDDLGI